MTELGELLSSFISKIPFTMGFLLFIIYLFISSDVFFSRILSRMDGATQLDSITTYGFVIQGLFLVGIYSIFYITLQYIS